MREYWKSVPNFFGLYSVSNMGNVLCDKKEVNSPIKNNKTIIRKEKLKVLDKVRAGYIRTCLYKNGKGKNFYVHRLVATAFIPNLNNLPQVNHKNGIKTDNRVENLEWVTRSENTRHSIKLGLFAPLGRPKGCVGPKRKLTSSDVDYVRKMYPRIGSARLARTFSMSQTAIMNCVTKRTYTNVTL